MPDPSGRTVLSVDFDGTMVKPNEEGVLHWLPGALEFLRQTFDNGIKVVIHSCRLTPHVEGSGAGDADFFWRTGEVASEFVREGWRMRQELVDVLLAADLLDLVELWEAPGKPLADIYVDDRSEKPDWYALARELGVDLQHARPTG